MCAVIHRAKPYQLAPFIKKNLDDVIGSTCECEATLRGHSTIPVSTFISPLSMPYLQKVPLMHLKKCVRYMVYQSKWLC